MDEFPDHRYADSPVGQLLDIGREVPAFIPDPLPSSIRLPDDVRNANADALLQLGQLNAVFTLEPEADLLIPSFVRVEAVRSSRIEGTRSTETDLYVFDATATPQSDDEIVRNYERALDAGLKRLERGQLSLDLVLEMHGILMAGEGHAAPGELRETQVHIGPSNDIRDATLVPPPPELVPDLMDDWEEWVNAPSGIDLLARAAMMHWQFETIHPFHDGNGRMGRLLILLFLIKSRALAIPLLYLSRWLEQHRSEYYEHLGSVTETGDWASWSGFMIDGVREEAAHAVKRGVRLSKLRAEVRARVAEAGASPNAIRLADALFRHPIVTRRKVCEITGVTPAGARLVVQKLIDIGLLRPREARGPALFEAPEILAALT